MWKIYPECAYHKYISNLILHECQRIGKEYYVCEKYIYLQNSNLLVMIKLNTPPQIHYFM